MIPTRPSEVESVGNKNEPNFCDAMSSLKQIVANRRNALKSTGPITPEGKERSRYNALRHGLTAETVIAALEDAEDYQAFEAAVIADYDVEMAVERELVLRLASVLWRLRRATGIESALFEAVTAECSKLEPNYSGPTLIAGADLSKSNQLLLGATRQSDAPETNEVSLDRKENIRTSSCAWPLCRRTRWIGSAVMNICCGGKPAS